MPIWVRICKAIQAQYPGLNNIHKTSQFCLDAASPTCYHAHVMQQTNLTYYYAGYKTQMPQTGGGFVCL
jgi:hypothetical protein